MVCPAEWSFLINPITSTGLPLDTLEEIYTKYCGPSTPIITRRSLAQLLCYYKNYCPTRFHPVIYGNTSSRSFHSKVTAMEDHLSSCMNNLENAWESRFRSSNRLPFPRVFPNRFHIRSILDTFPVKINKPMRNQRNFYSGKYKAHCVKFQALSDFEGNIIWFSGPYAGSRHDKALWVENHPTFSRGEKCMADLAYIGEDCRNLGCITGFKKPRNGSLSNQQKNYNEIFNHFRVRVEHTFGFLKRYNILGGKYRGKSYTGENSRLSKIVKILINAQYIHTRRHPLRQMNQEDYED